jgi:polyhydroxyalkanoate synthase
VSEPGRSGRRYRLRQKSEQDHYLDPDAWVRGTDVRPGSWWPAWASWLTARSGTLVRPPAVRGSGLGPLADAPGTYVREP